MRRSGRRWRRGRLVTRLAVVGTVVVRVVMSVVLGGGGFPGGLVLFSTWVRALVFKAFGTFVVFLSLMLIALVALRNRRVGELRQSLVRDLVPVLDQHAQREM